MNYYGYVRVSTSTQVTDGYGLDTQIDAINNWANVNDQPLSEIFIDEGISGASLERPDLSALLSVIQKDDCVVVLNTSRLWRGDFATAIIKHELKKAGANIISIEQPQYDLYVIDPEAIFFNGITELLDQYDRLMTIRKLAGGRRTKARNGSKACGAVPFGYKWENRHVVIDYNNHIVVKEIFQKFLESRSFSKVASYCESRDYRTTTGKLFSRQAIRHILQNDFYVGIVTHAGKKSQGTHTPIIESYVWDSVQKILSKSLEVC